MNIIRTLNNQQALKAIGLSHTDAFIIPIGSENLICQKVLRVMSNKRLVVRGIWQNNPVVAKIFFSKNAVRHLRKEIHGIDVAKKLNILTPVQLYHGTSNIPAVYIVITRYQESSIQNNDNIWQGNDTHALKHFLWAIQDILCTLHQNGYAHTDPHPHNFIIDQDRLYLVDATDVIGHRKQLGLSRRKSLQNLAALYAQLYVQHQPLILDAFAYYCRQREWALSPLLQKQFDNALQIARHNRILETIKRSARNCKEISIEQTKNRWIAISASQNKEIIMQTLSNIETHIRQGKILKKGNTCTVARIQAEQKTWIVKRYNIKDSTHLMKNFWRTSRAIKNWRYMHILNLFGIQTPQPIAVMLNRWHAFHGKAYLIMTDESGKLLSDLPPPNNISTHRFLPVVKKAVQMLKNLRLLQMTQNDTKATNFIIQNDQLILLDLESIKQHRKPQTLYAAYQKSLQRFLRNWEMQPNIQQQLSHLLQTKD